MVKESVIFLHGRVVNYVLSKFVLNYRIIIEIENLPVLT